jgi:MerR family transcriptional regulator, light-induced transcriptional regulator
MMAPADFTATQLSELTGVAPGTLRVWETRHGFPAARRLPGNRKRYGDLEVEQVKTVMEHRRAGLSLTAAIQRVRTAEPERSESMFAALRDARPDLPVRVYPKPLVLALSRAIEDEQAARATGGVLLGSFQRERHYRASERRWKELSRTAALTVVLADFARFTDSATGPIEVPLAQSHPLEREWAVVLHSGTASACLAAWEVPSPRPLPESERRFELIWSCDPSAAHAAVLSAATVLGTTHPGVAARIPAAALKTPAPTLSHQRFSDDLTVRAFAYLTAAAAYGGVGVVADSAHEKR